MVERNWRICYLRRLHIFISKHSTQPSCAQPSGQSMNHKTMGSAQRPKFGARIPPKLIITRSKTPPKHSLPPVRVTSSSGHLKLDNHHHPPTTCMASVSRQLSPAFVPSVSPSSIPPSHFKCRSNPPSPNYLQPNFFDFDSRPFQPPPQSSLRPTSASRFGRQLSSPRLSVPDLHKTSLSSSSGNAGTTTSRSLSPSVFPHGNQLSPIANQFPGERQFPQTATAPLGQSAYLRGQDPHRVPSHSPAQNGGKSTSPSTTQPWKKYFKVNKSLSVSDTECTNSSTTGSKRTFDRKQLERSRTVDFGSRPSRNGSSMRMSFSRARGSCSTPTKPLLTKSNRLEDGNNLEPAEKDPLGAEKPEGDANRLKEHGSRRPSSVSLRQRLALLRDSLSLDSPDPSSIRCQDFGIRDYLSRTNESLDNEEESSLAGDINAGLGIPPPRFSIDSLDSHLSFLLELNEKKDALLPLSRSPSISKPQTVRRKSDETGMLRKTSTVVNIDSAPQPVTHSHHADFNNIAASATSSSANVRMLRKSNSLPHAGALRALPKIQEGACTIIGLKAPLVQESAGASTSDTDSDTLKDKHRPEVKLLSREKGTIDELDDDEDWIMDDCVITMEDVEDHQEAP